MEPGMTLMGKKVWETGREKEALTQMANPGDKYDSCERGGGRGWISRLLEHWTSMPFCHLNNPQYRHVHVQMTDQPKLWKAQMKDRLKNGQSGRRTWEAIGNGGQTVLRGNLKRGRSEMMDNLKWRTIWWDGRLEITDNLKRLLTIEWNLSLTSWLLTSDSRLDSGVSAKEDSVKSSNYSIKQGFSLGKESVITFHRVQGCVYDIMTK